MDDIVETMTATTRKREEIEREAEENRKEALLASTQSLQPNFNRSNITQKQISKLQVRFLNKNLWHRATKIMKINYGSVSDFEITHRFVGLISMRIG